MLLMQAKMRKDRFSISLLGVAFLLLFVIHFAEAKDLYKILGVEKNASHRDIQKAFHKLSLKYHPDKNPSKNAEGKFAEINNAYEVLSDDEKRKNYDLFGDEQGRPRGSDASDAHNGGYYDYDQKGKHGGSQGWSQGGSHGWRQGDSHGWSHFSYSSNDDDGYRFEQSQHGYGGGDGSYDEGDRFSFPFGSNFQGQKRSSFSFGGNESPFENLFNSFFGTAQGGKSEQQRFTSSTTGNTGKKEKAGYREGHESIDISEQLNPKSFANRVLGQLYTWAILFTPHVSWELRERLELLEAISESLRGSIKVGYINCEKYHEFCKEYKMWPLKTSKLLVFSLRRNGKLGALDYTGKWSEKDVKSFCVEALPNFSMHMESIESLNAEIEDVESSSAVLLTQKKAASAMWRALSGLFHERIHFFDLQIKDYDTIAKMFRVDSFPAIIGVYQNGESKVLADGIMLDQTNPSVDDLKTVLEEFEKKSKAAGTKKAKTTESIDVPHLTKKNMRKICSEETPLCVIGAYKSSKGMEKVKQILEEISHKTLIRRGQNSGASKKPISFCIVDGTRQSTFLNSFHPSLSKENGAILIAYKPKKGTFVSYDGVLTLENVENFVLEVLNGDLHFNKVSRDPVLV